jgi:hypothetical protein
MFAVRDGFPRKPAKEPFAHLTKAAEIIARTAERKA